MEYGLIGEHLGHSFSAIIHGKIANYPYELKELSQTELPAFMQKKDFKAINVTIPYKQAVIDYLDEIDENAKKIGAVNTVVNRSGKLIGYNTDFFGMKALADKIGVSLEGKKVLILGSGGTARTANAVAASLGADQILTVSRSDKENCITYESVYKDHLDAEYIINTTPVGLYPNQDGTDGQLPTPIDLTAFPNLKGVLDAIFNPLRTNLICHAKKNGTAADGGLYMLVAQAVYAAEKFLDTALDKSIIDRIYDELRSQIENIVLIGMPGCGKSTVGKRLAKLLNRPSLT
jgi:shikimate dehydrogenase